MANDDKLQGQSNDLKNAASNAERDQDAGNMNNGTLGGNFANSDSNKTNDEDASSKSSNESAATSS